MDRQAHDYAAAMAFAQQQQQQAGLQQQFGFNSQHQQFPQQVLGPPFLPPHPSLQQLPFHRQMPPQQQFYPHHHHPLVHLQQQPQPSAFAPHLPPRVGAPFVQPFDSVPPPAAPPPSDPELQKRIDKAVEYAVKNGPDFELVIRERQQGNPDYNFLFGGEGHDYYRYKLWLSTRPPSQAFNPSFPSSSMPMMPSPHNPMLNPPPLGGPPASMLAAQQLHQPPFPPYYDQHQQLQHSQAFLGQNRVDYEPSTKPFKGLSGPLPSDVAAELSGVLSNLTGTKESIKGAKMWFMQRSPFAPALAEALRDWIFALDDSERQLHIIFLANDILFDSLQRRPSLQELDNEALAFKPVLGAMLARIYNNPQNKDANQSRLEKILQFWASKEVYDPETIGRLESEMTGGIPSRSTPQREVPTASEPSGLHHSPALLQPEKQRAPGSLEESEKQLPPSSAPHSQFASSAVQPYLSNQLTPGIYPPVAQVPFPGPLPIPAAAPAANVAVKATPPYPLFPPGLIPGMVRKMQIGSGVPYSPLSPLDIPTVIPPSTVPPSEVLERVSRFFKEIGEVNPSEGPMKQTESNDEFDDYERASPPIRKGGACIPPPPNLQQMDPETGMHADGSVDHKSGSGGSGRLGLGATANPNEISQYDDVYTSYRKQRSTSYHSSMSARASAK